MSALKSFFLGAAKIAVAIVISIVVIVGIWWGVDSFSTHRDAVKNVPLEIPKIWSSITIGALDNSHLYLTTRWSNGRMSYQFEMKGYPKSLASQFETQQPYSIRAPGFTLTFLDKNGFKLFDEEIPLNKTTRVVSDDGKGTGLSARGDTYVSADNYRQALSWEVTWLF